MLWKRVEEDEDDDEASNSFEHGSLFQGGHVDRDERTGEWERVENGELGDFWTLEFS